MSIIYINNYYHTKKYKDFLMLLFNSKISSFKNLLRFSAFNSYQFSIVKFNLPDLAEKIKEGTIKRLYVKEGDYVK